MSMSRSLMVGLFALIGATLSGGCGAVSGREVTATAGGSLVQIATATAILPPTRTSPPMCPPPTPTPSTPGLRAAPIPETVDLTVDTPLENLRPGEYLAILDEDTFEKDGTVAFDYLAWDGEYSGDLFHFESKPSLDELPLFVTPAAGRLWFEVEDPQSLYSVSLSNLKPKQLGYGPDCEGVVSPLRFGPGFFVFGCLSRDGSPQYLHSVGVDDLRIAGTWKFPEGVSIIGWYGADRLEFSAAWRPGRSSFRYCVVEPPDWVAACRDLAFHVGTTSPTGEWTWVAPNSTDDEMPQTEFPIAVVPRSCVDRAPEGCEPKTIFPAAWKGQYETFETYPSWSPDGRTLIVLDYAGSECAPVWVWAYDTLTATARGIAKVTGCAMDTTDQLAWSKDSEHFVVTRVSPTDSKYKNVVVALDGTTYPLPTTDFVAASFVVP